jgi:hypothetical protein
VAIGVIIGGGALAGMWSGKAGPSQFALVGPNCGIQLGGPPAFCETFNQPAGTGNRSGDLNGNIWGVSRLVGASNFGDSNSNPWAKTDLNLCGQIVNVLAPQDVRICNGQLREAVNDHDQVVILAMYPKQPLDWAGRTGTVAFDVSNDTQGAHAAWPEFWITDAPNPAPFAFGDNWVGTGKHSFGLRLMSSQGAFCQGAPWPGGKWTVDSGTITRNYVQSSASITVNDCVTRPQGPNGGLNHVEVRVNVNTIEVWATDAGTTTPLKKIATVNNANLSFTRGLVWIDDVHYDAAKSGGQQTTHTFAWDNVAFDGPFTYQDRSFDVLDRLLNNGNGTYSLGWQIPRTLNTLPIPSSDLSNAASAKIMWNFWSTSAPTGGFDVSVNGHAHHFAWPFPDAQGFTWRTIYFDLPLSDLVSGANTIAFGNTSPAYLVSNINIVLVNVAGAGGGTPSPTQVTTSTPTSTAVAPTSTPAPVTPTPTATSVSPTPTPAPVCREAYFEGDVLKMGAVIPCP